MFTKRKVKKFVDKFGKFLHDEYKESYSRYDETCKFDDFVRCSTYHFVFQIFGRYVEQELGIKFFDDK